MRVLFLTQYFAPEVGATQSRTLDMARALVNAGHRVVLICEVPNHPKGVVWPSYRRKAFVRDVLDGIEVIRVWVYTSQKKTTSRRLAFYVSYMAMAVAAGMLLTRGRFDLVFASSPPLLVAAAGSVLGLLRRLPFVMEVRDPWPAAAEAMGELRNSRAVTVARRVEAICYRRANRIITVTEGWRRLIVAQGVPEQRIEVVANGANPAVFYPRPAEAAQLRQALSLDDKFVVLYLGLHGLAQGLDVVLRAADRLRHLEDVVVVFVGEGPRKAALKALAQDLALPNVRFYAEVPQDSAAALFTMADAALVPLRRIELFEGMVPAKLYDAWACGCPVIAAGEGELAALVQEADGGLCVEPENEAALADAIRTLRSDRDRLRRAGEAARRFVKARFNRNTQAVRFIEILQHAAQR